MKPAPPVTRAFTRCVLRGHVAPVERRARRRRPRRPDRRRTARRAGAPDADRRPGRPTIEPSTTAPLPMRAPGSTTESRTTAPGADLRRRPSPRCGLDARRRVADHGRRVDRPLGRAPHAVDQVELRLQVGGRACRRRPSRRRSAGRTASRSATIAGKVSRSIDTRRPAGMRSSTRRLEHVGAGVDPVGRRLAGRRLLDEGLDPAVVVDRHHAVARRIVDRGEGDGALGARFAGGTPTARPTSRSVSTSPLTTRKVCSMPPSSGGEADRAGRVERLGLDGVVQGRPRRRCRRDRPR